MTPYDRLKQLGLELLTPAVPVANYVPFVFANGFLYLSGQGPRKADGSQHTGKVGAEVTMEQAYLHAQLTGLNLLSVAHLALGDLGRWWRGRLRAKVVAITVYCNVERIFFKIILCHKHL